MNRTFKLLKFIDDIEDSISIWESFMIPKEQSYIITDKFWNLSIEFLTMNWFIEEVSPYQIDIIDDTTKEIWQCGWCHYRDEDMADKLNEVIRVLNNHLKYYQW